MSAPSNGVKTPSTSDSWETLSSLEHVVQHSFMDSDEKSPYTESHITLHQCPELVVSTVRYLIAKHSNLRTGANVTRAATKCGLLYLAKWRELAVLKIAGDQVYEHGNEKARLKVANRSFEFELSIGKIPYTCYCFRYVAAAIANISAFLGLPGSTVATVTLIAAFSLSEEWLPRNRVQEFEQELKRFKEWVTGEVRKFPGDVVINQPIRGLIMGSDYQRE
jgi:hypothetical protein